MSAPPKLAYLFARYPVPSQTFCDSEMLALEAAGMPLAIHATSPPRTHFRHERLAELRAEVHYLPPQKIIRAHVLRAERAGQWPPAIIGEHEQRYGKRFRPEPRARHALALADSLQREGIAHVHCHFSGHAAHTARLMREIKGIPYSFTAHAQDFMVDLDDDDLLRELCREAEFVVAVSDWSRDKLRETCPDSAEKIIRIYNGIDPSDFEPASHAQRTRPRIISIARLIEFKGFHHLVDACAELRQRGVDFECTIVGDGPWQERLEEQVRGAGLTEHVRLAGLLSRDEVRAALRESDVFALAATVDGEGACDVLPTVIMEAMASGLPVVSTRLAGIPEMVEEGRSGRLAEPGDAQGLADALAPLLASRDLRRAHGEAGRKRVPELFSSERVTPQLRERFEASIARNPTPTPAPPTFAYLVDQWPPRRAERLEGELAALDRLQPGATVLAGGLDPGFEPTARDADLETATRVEFLPDGIVLEAHWQANRARAAGLDALRHGLPSFFSGEQFYTQARRALYLADLLERRGIQHLHAARSTSILCAWLIKQLCGMRTSFALDRRTAPSRRSFARLCADLDFGCVSDDLLVRTVRQEADEGLPLIAPLPGASWLDLAALRLRARPNLERRVSLEAFLARLARADEDTPA